MEEAFGLCLGVIGFFVHVTITWVYKEFCLFNSWHQFSPLSTDECKKELIISSLQHPVLLMAHLPTIVTHFYTCMWNILIRHLSTTLASLHTFQSLVLHLDKFPLHYHIFWICFRDLFVIYVFNQAYSCENGCGAVYGTKNKSLLAISLGKMIFPPSATLPCCHCPWASLTSLTESCTLRLYAKNWNCCGFMKPMGTSCSESSIPDLPSRHLALSQMLPESWKEW